VRGSRRVGPIGGGDPRSSLERPGFRPRFFVDSEPSDSWAPGADAVPETTIVLGVEDSHHALKVLRVREGDRCELVTPSGRVYDAIISAAVDPVHVKPVARLDGAAAGAAYRVRVGVVQALARPSVMDYAIEKGTEVGANFFLLISTVGSARMPEGVGADRLARWRRIAREAAKQSKQTAVPSVDLAESVSGGLDRMAGSGALTVVMEPRAPHSLPDVLRAILARRRPSGEGFVAEEPSCVALWVGPEGGWTEAELRLLSSSGAATARLGRAVLRTETAGPVAVVVARLELGDW
jgi:16S rRNA (uracil1498-N3)-methyltransferase